jgi:hypothetical protein
LLNQANGFLDNRFFTQGLQILRAAGLSVLEKQLLELVIELSHQSGREGDVEDYARELSQLMQKESLDMTLVKSRKELIQNFPVSIVA